LVEERAYSVQVFNNGLDLVPLPDSTFWLVVEQAGKIWAFPQDESSAERHLFADLKALHPEVRNAYSVQFHPKFTENRQVFVVYTAEANLENGSTLARFTVPKDGPPRIDPATEVKLLHWRSGGHNGAALQFGNDGYLYISTGDSEVPAPPDPLNTGQDLDDLLSCILRVDVDRPHGGLAYSIPQDNPFLTTPGARPEIWAFGFRNPWKMAFDRATGRLWCTDVGWELWEMVHLVTRGGNYGWSALEAAQPIKPETRNPVPITPPVVAHPHTEAASITGGFVYRGKAFPELMGAYIYGDYETGKVWALWHDGQRIKRLEEVADTPHKIVTFGEAPDGELFYLHYGGETTLHRFRRNPMAGKTTDFPKRLSETGLFADTAAQVPSPGVLPFDVAAPLWSDGASAQRYVALPEGTPAVDTRLKKGKVVGSPIWPKDAVLARTIQIETEAGNAQSARKLETQLLHFDGVAWQGYSYRWNDHGTDADLVPADGAQLSLTVKDPAAPGGTRRYDHRFHSRAECMRCHTVRNNYIGSYQPQQLLNAQAHVDAGIIDAVYLQQSAARLVNPNDKSAPLEQRARSWLHANCSHCHRRDGGGSVAMLLNAELDLAATKMVDATPQRGTFGIEDAKIIAPGSPGHSVLLHRIAISGAGHMPVVGSREVDVHGLNMLEEWIRSLPPTGTSDLAQVAEAAVVRWVTLARGGASDLDEAFHVLVSGSPANAMRLLNYLDSGEASPEVIRETVSHASRSPDHHVRALFERFQPTAERPITLGPTLDVPALLAHVGNAKRGAAILTMDGKGATCLACHIVQGTGRDFGPDLGKVGARLSKTQLLESILKPSQTIAPGYSAVTVTLKNGESQVGFIVAETPESLTLKTVAGTAMNLNTSDVASRQALPVSLMPEGQHQALTAQEMADLLAYLESLK
jgi:putative heme-binding domain-containing protein